MQNLKRLPASEALRTRIRYMDVLRSKTPEQSLIAPSSPGFFLFFSTLQTPKHINQWLFFEEKGQRNLRFLQTRKVLYPCFAPECCEKCSAAGQKLYLNSWLVSLKYIWFRYSSGRKAWPAWSQVSLSCNDSCNCKIEAISKGNIYESIRGKK